MKDSVRQDAAAGLLRGTLAEIEESERVWRGLKASGAAEVEWRRAMFATGRICQRKHPKPRPSQVDLRIKSALQAEERARKAEAVARDVFSGVPPEEVEAMRKLVMGGYETYVNGLLRDMATGGAVPGMTERESAQIREKAKDRYHDLLKMFAGKQVDKEPKRAAASRQVLVREWPNEGFKG